MSSSSTSGARLALLTVLLLASCAGQSTQTFRSNYQRTKTGDRTTDTQTNLLELGVQDELGPGFEYRLSERVIHTSQDLDDPAGSTESEALLHQPSLDLILSVGALTWIQGYEVQTDRTEVTGSPDDTLVRRDVLQRFEWTPEGLPLVTGWFNYRTVENDRFLDQTTLETVFEIEETRGPFDYLYSLENEQLDDRGTNQEIDRQDHILRGSFSDQTDDGSLSTTVTLFGEERSTETTSPASGLVLNQQPPVAGLSIRDTTPQIATLAPNAALVDNDENASAGIDIGGFAAGGQLSFNFGVELVPGTTIDTIDIHTVDPVDPFQAPQFAFSVWESSDNAFWTLVTASAPFGYDQVFERFRLTLPKISSRFVKVVNTATAAAAPSVLVSEVRVFETTVAGGTTSLEVEDSIRNASFNLTWRPAPRVTVAYDAFVQTTETESFGSVTRDEFRVDHGLTATWSPRDDVDVNVHGEVRRREDDFQPDEDTILVNGRTIYRPLDTLDLTLSHTATDRDVDGVDDLATRATQVGASAQLLETLEAEVILEVNEQDDDRNLRKIRRDIAAASLLAQMTPELDVTLGVRHEEAEVTGPNADQIPDPTERRYEVTMIYQPSDRISGDVQLEWKDALGASGLDQRYRLDWVPFRDGALDVQFAFDRIDTGSGTNDQLDSYQVLTRWNFAPNVFLELNYTAQVPDSQARTEIVTVAFNATL